MRCVKIFTGLIGIVGLAFALHASQNAFAADLVPRSAQMPAVIGIASFNMAWAGTAGDFKKHLEICSAPTVNWCDTRPRTLRGADAPTVEEQARADACQAATIPATRIFDIRQVRELPALAGKLTRTTLPDGRTVHMQPMAVDLDGVQRELGFAPRYGEHTRAVLAEAGLAGSEIDALAGAGVVA